MNQFKRILIMDNDKLTASVVKLYLNNIGHTSIDNVTNIDTLEAMAQEDKPDVILFNQKTASSDTNALDLIKILTTKYCENLLLISELWKSEAPHDNPNEFISSAIKSGAKGFINLPLREIDLRTSLLQL